MTEIDEWVYSFVIAMIVLTTLSISLILMKIAPAVVLVLGIVASLTTVIRFFRWLFRV